MIRILTSKLCHSRVIHVLQGLSWHDRRRQPENVQSNRRSRFPETEESSRRFDHCSGMCPYVPDISFVRQTNSHYHNETSYRHPYEVTFVGQMRPMMCKCVFWTITFFRIGPRMDCTSTWKTISVENIICHMKWKSLMVEQSWSREAKDSNLLQWVSLLKHCSFNQKRSFFRNSFSLMMLFFAESRTLPSVRGPNFQNKHYLRGIYYSRTEVLPCKYGSPIFQTVTVYN